MPIRASRAPREPRGLDPEIPQARLRPRVRRRRPTARAVSCELPQTRSRRARWIRPPSTPRRRLRAPSGRILVKAGAERGTSRQSLRRTGALRGARRRSGRQDAPLGGPTRRASLTAAVCSEALIVDPQQGRPSRARRGRRRECRGLPRDGRWPVISTQPPPPWHVLDLERLKRAGESHDRSGTWTRSTEQDPARVEAGALSSRRFRVDRRPSRPFWTLVVFGLLQIL